MIKEDYVSYEIAKLLVKKGFDPIWIPELKCTIQMAMKWLEEKGIAIIPIVNSILDNKKFLWDIKIVVAKTGETYSQGWVYEKRPEACDAAIKYCLENLI